MRESIVLVSGGFDPLHDGHVEYIEQAARYGEVIVALNSDAWLERKKGYAFMSWAKRSKVMGGLKGVFGVYPVDDRDDTVCDAIRSIRPRYFAKGGDRGPSNTPEIEVCKELGVEALFGLGEKINSSSELVRRRWGAYEVLYESARFKVKRLLFQPRQATSIQRHAHRSEVWVTSSGGVRVVPVGQWHQYVNDTDAPQELIEVQTGDYFGEDDIERRE